MPVDLADLLRPAQTTVVTQECQNGVIGADAVFPELAEIARNGMLDAAARLVHGARAAGVQVVHCLAQRRDDGLGTPVNTRLHAAAARSPAGLAPGSREAEVVPEIGRDPSDLASSRLHGVAPMWGTNLDPLLRAVGTRTVVAVGVSVNVGLTGLVIGAVDAGYQVVVPRDAVAGLPREYADAVIEHTLSLIATITTTDGVLAAWSSDGS